MSYLFMSPTNIHKKELKIGILDSGLGGLTTLRALEEKWPATEFVYFGDTARAPYGTKSAGTICEFASGGAGYLVKQGARMIVITCHTIAGVAGQYLASAMDVPVVDGIVPSAQQALKATKKKTIGILGSRALLDSGRYPEVIGHLQPRALVHAAAAPLIVPLIHAGRLGKPEASMSIKKALHPLKVRQIDTLILTNPYYTLMAPIIQRKIGRRVTLVDPSDSLVAKLGDIIPVSEEPDQTKANAQKLNIWVTDLTTESASVADMLYGRSIRLKQL